jgi:ATP-dependent Lhr-like helicase
VDIAPSAPADPQAGLAWAHPVVRDWFVSRFGTPTEPQMLGWPHILEGRSVLISAPTGSGKTLAAFLTCIDRLVRLALDGTLTDRTEIVYVSPLKALGNDIQKNLEGPLAEIAALARDRGLTLPDIRTAVRTGDTLMPARRAMLKRPPHILVTTPESLYILLTADGSRRILRDVNTVIVDEIHAVADDKRGAHLALTLERLDALTGRGLTRIGLSATQKPIEVVADFLGGAGRPRPTLVEVAPRRALDLAVEVPGDELGPVATHELWDEIYDRIAAHAAAHRSTLVFVNTRRLAERVTHHLAERLGEAQVAAHHGSLARKSRLEAERRLKAGELRALVATASLELGIDIGTIDLVCHIGSPRSIAVALQRVGRAGHWRGAVPKGRFFATTRDELVECTALVLAIRRGELDQIRIPDSPLDVLAQQIVAMAAAEDWDEEALFALVTRAYPYRDLSRTEFDEIVTMLAEGISAKRGRYAAYLHHDRVNGRIRARRGARLAAITSGGAIPETGLYTVVAEPEGTVVGTVDEDFAVESLAGDIMLLGNASWRIRRVTSAGRVLVEDAHGAAPTIPFWRGEAPARTIELSRCVSEVRAHVSTLAPDVMPGGAAARVPESAAAIAWLERACGLDRSGAEQVLEYVVAGRTVLGAVPTTRTVVAERFFDEGGGMQLVIHAPFGARINKAWGLALRKRFCRSFNFELQAAATDNGINISLAEQHSFPLADVFGFLRPATVAGVLQQAALPSPIFGTRWRWDAGRALAIQRFRGGRKLPIHILRLQSDDLLAAVFPDVAACPENLEGDIDIPSHPLVREVMKDVMTEAMDLPGLVDLLTDIGRGAVRCLAVDTPVPSVFSHEILNANPYAYLDDAPLEERRARAVEMRRSLPPSVLSEVGALDPNAIAEVCAQAWPDVRHADDLHDALLTFIAWPASLSAGAAGVELATRVANATRAWAPLLEELARERRAGTAEVDGRRYWVAAERRETFLQLFPGARLPDELARIAEPARTDTDASVALAQGWLTHSGPVTVNELAALLALSPDRVEEAVLRLEASGWALRGQFRPRADMALETVGRGADGRPRTAAMRPLEWCERRLLARIHRLTIGTLRREIAPVTRADFMRWLLDWQHAAPGTQTRGAHGLFEVIRQLQGFEAPANAWELQILSRRVADYDPADLDQLCLSGVVGWGRLSPHPATIEAPAGSGRRIMPTSVAPITFFVREDADWLTPRPFTGTAPAGLSANARDVLQHLTRAGASFFPDIVRASGHLKAEVEAALWELVAAGLVTADGFDNLRALVDSRRRAGQGHGRATRPRHSAGRWARLHPDPMGDAMGSDPKGPKGSGLESRPEGRDSRPDPFLHRPRVLESACWMLLRRYGVVFRELVGRESNVPLWRDLLHTFRRLEDRGEVRGGRFVDGVIGEQFALPIAVESLRAFRHRPVSDAVVTIAATDPLNLTGIILPGDRVAAIPGRVVSLSGGRILPTVQSSLPAPAP